MLLKFTASFYFLFLLISGCATDVANRYYGTTKYSPKSERDVAILTSKPSKDFVVIADFQSRGDTSESLRSKAAEIGADAVIVSVIGGLYSHAEEWAGKDSMQGVNSQNSGHIVGTAIKYK